MKISNNYNQISPSYKGLWNNKTVLKGLETISEHSTSFVALTTLAMAAGVRPLVINATPKVKKENKEYATTNSIASGLVKFGLVEALAIPVENAVKKIDKNPEKFLSAKTIKALQGSAKTLAESKHYKFATQVIKMGTSLITAIPKAIVTVALIPILMDLLFKNKKQDELQQQVLAPEQKQIAFKHNQVFDEFYNEKSPSFKGNLTTQVAKGIGQTLNNSTVQNLVKKFSSQDKNVARNVSMLTDVLLTTSFAFRTQKSDKIEKDRKKALIANNVISTGISLLGGYSIDKLVQKNTMNFIEKFKQLNKNDPKLPKYIEGINIVRPTLIFAVIYYAILPMFTTFISDKLDKSNVQRNKQQ